MHIFRAFGSILFIYFESFEYKNVAFSHIGIFKFLFPFKKKTRFLKKKKTFWIYLKAKSDIFTVSEVAK